jgi:hypothetical protein
MIRDYLLAVPWTSPLDYARNYYGHYPKIAIGNWPPLFYAVEGIWMLVFPDRPGSAFVLVALLLAILCVLVYRVARRFIGALPAVAVSTLLIALPVTQTTLILIMTEIPVALLTFVAASSFVRFLDRSDRRSALWFGLVSSAAILTKGTGFALALAAPLAVFFTNQWRTFTTRNFYLPLLVVVPLCLPWNLATRDILREGWIESSASSTYTFEALRYYPTAFLQDTSFAYSLLAVLAIVAAIPAIRRGGQRSHLLATHLAVVCAVLLFHLVIPAALEVRYMVPLLPSLAVLQVHAFHSVAGWARRARHTTWLAAGFLIAAAFVSAATNSPRKREQGYARLAAELTVRLTPRDTMLISSDARGEGAFIVGTAVHDLRPGHVVHRSSKLFASMTWLRDDYRLLASSVPELLETLRAAGVRYVVVDRSVPRRQRMPHHDLLEEAVTARPDVFRLVLQTDVIRRGSLYDGRLGVYNLVEPPPDKAP